MKVKHYLKRIKKTTVYNHNSNSEIIKDLVSIAELQAEQIDALWMRIEKLETPSWFPALFPIEEQANDPS